MPYLVILSIVGTASAAAAIWTYKNTTIKPTQGYGRKLTNSEIPLSQVISELKLTNRIRNSSQIYQK